ncbi:12343_t:CDS:2, partial [Racocetra persica]
FVHPVNALDIQSAIKCGAKLNFTVIARSGGHSLEGYSIEDRDCDLIVDLRYMNKIIMDMAIQTAIIETGNTLDTLFRSLNEHVFAFPTGECSTASVDGIILGGGHRYLMRKFGMSSDNILDAQIVLANRTIINHAKGYHDLFWALRGARNAGYSSLNEAKPHIQEFIKLTKSKNESCIELDWYYANIADMTRQN